MAVAVNLVLAVVGERLIVPLAKLHHSVIGGVHFCSFNDYILMFGSFLK